VSDRQFKLIAIGLIRMHFTIAIVVPLYLRYHNDCVGGTSQQRAMIDTWQAVAKQCLE
jgi:hypothetical protein